jgi:hypothetical protein
MTIDGSPDLTPLYGVTEDRSFGANPGLTPGALRERQNAKIREIKDALAALGVATLDKQAQVLGLSRSTTWHLLSGKHKGSGLSATVINRMLAAPHLPTSARLRLLEYIAEKVAGRYGDNKLRLRKFTARLPRAALDHVRAMRPDIRGRISEVGGRRSTRSSN